MRHKFFNIYIDDISQEQLLKQAKPSFIVTMNLEQFFLSQKDDFYKKVLLEADFIVADGISIVLLSKILGISSLSKIPGIDLAKKFIQQSSRIALLGASEEVIEKLKNIFSEKIVFAHHGYFSDSEEQKIIDQIQDSRPDLLLVALGSPRQESLIYRHKSRFPATTLIGVGGSFDIWAERLLRAPKWMRDLNLEWLFRIVQEPNRIFRLLYILYGLIIFFVSNLFDECYKDR